MHAFSKMSREIADSEHKANDWLFKNFFEKKKRIIIDYIGFRVEKKSIILMRKMDYNRL